MFTIVQDFVPYLAASFLGSGVTIIIYSIAAKRITRNLVPRALGVGLLALGILLFAVFPVGSSFREKESAPKSTQQGSTEMTFRGKVRIDGGFATFYPVPGQTLTVPTLLIMKDIPKDGTTQQRFKGAASVFADQTSLLSINGVVTPFAGDQVLVVDGN